MNRPGSKVVPETGRSVAVFGGGISGLTVAHELSRLNYRVSVYEAAEEVGGFFRSAREDTPKNLPAEYSWHGLGPWYHNAFDLMKQIRMGHRTVYDQALSRPIDFGILPEDGKAQFYDRRLRSIRGMFRFTRRDLAGWAWLMLKTWCAHRRTEERYARLNAAERWQRVLSDRANRTWRSCFGPWIGSDWTRASLHHAGQFFRKQLITKPAHRHEADADGPAWTQGAGDGWLLFRGPSSEYWFAPWLAQLRERGVTVHCSAPLERLEFDGSRITSARLQGGEEVRADLYVLSTTPFAAAEVVERNAPLQVDPELKKFRPLIQDGPHVQVSFRLAFAEPIKFPRKRMAVVVADSEFNLTLFAQEQAWEAEVDLGEGVRSLWTGTSCVSTVPGRLYGLPVGRCTEQQFIEEVKAQIFACESLQALVAEANGGRRLEDFALLGIYPWHEWAFSPEGISGPQPKWVTTTHTQPYLPNQATSIPNLFLAGAHTRTEADVWSIEGAVESGRRAAKAIDSRVSLKHQYKPLWMRAIGRVDDVCFRLRLPHVLDVAAGLAVGAVLWALLYRAR
jgi:glycine/D-amino acid oxidase-like deaminating enzyme